MSISMNASKLQISSQIDEPINVLFKVCDKFAKKSSFNYFAFGGWIRDTLLGEKTNDLDFYISSEDICKEVIGLLDMTGRIFGSLKKQYLYGGEHFCTYRFSFVKNNGESIQVDIVTQQVDPHTVVPFNNCDFTCNNLILRSDGTIGTRVKSPRDSISNSEWTLCCIRDAMQKNLVWMVETPVNQTFEKKMETSWKMEERLNKMMLKGYRDSRLSLTFFKILKPKTHLDVKEGCEPSSECAICQDKFNERLRTVKLECDHDFHFNCIKKWRLDQDKNTCPICRANIRYKLEGFFFVHNYNSKENM